MIATLLLTALLQQPAAEPTPAATPPAHDVVPAEVGSEQGHATEAHPSEGHEPEGEGEHESVAEILIHHVVDGRWFGLPSKHLAFFVIAAVVVLLSIRVALRSYKEGHVPTGLAAAVEALVLFIRDDIAEKNIGHHDGAKYTPLLCSFFFFILIAALLGLLPLSATSTGNLAVTAALATISFLAQQYAGIAKNGLGGHLGHLAPPGLPTFLLPIMIPVEILGMFTKPFALMIRLFANMLAGHMVITTLLLLIPLMAKITPAAGWMMSPVSLGLSLFIMLLELLVAFIQAYIFTLLTAIFIGMYVHPAH
jgi:F-type H+-transporting ATPase subunit a